MNWYQNPQYVSHMSYRSMVKTQSVEYAGTWFDGDEDNLNHLSRFAYKPQIDYGQRKLETFIKYIVIRRIQALDYVANMYKNTTWNDIIGSMNHYQPEADKECTLAVLNPFTYMLDWVSISCDRKHNMSTIICLRDQHMVSKS